MTGEQFRIHQDVHEERARQEALKVAGKFKYSCADPELSNGEKALVLGEETCEVFRAVLNIEKLATDEGRDDLRTELIQVAAVCMAWVECLDLK